MTDRRGRNKGSNRGGAHPPRSPSERRPDKLWIYGIHPVAAALGNRARIVHRVLATGNAQHRLTEMGVAINAPVEAVTPRDLHRLLGPEAVHQGLAAETAPLPLRSLADLGPEASLVVVLDQVTDPHNVGAILRSAAAMAADALVMTGRHSPTETGVLAKAASGALDLVPVVTVGNLASALIELGEAGFRRIGLDSDGPQTLEGALSGKRIALVLGAEGKGLRRLTRETCDAVARLDLPGPMDSLNVSNAAALALYVARRSIGSG